MESQSVILPKPPDVFGRDTEWFDLTEFANSKAPGLRIAIMYGHQRQGKSYLLRRLAEADNGLYHLATEQTEIMSVRRFADSLTAFLGMPPGVLPFDNWEKALRTAINLMTQRINAAGSEAAPRLLVLDEFPYLTHENSGLPSIVQTLYDEFGPGSMSSQIPLRIVLCGSAISVMSELLSGTKALRGRAALELRVKSFGYRDARAYWGIKSVETAFLHNALIGGTPGYRDLVINQAVPESPKLIGEWMTQNVLRPSVPLFGEATRVIHEDPRIRDTAAYSSLLAAIAAGESSPAKIGGLMGRPAASLAHQLGMLESAGFVYQHDDLLMRRRPTITVADPIMRLHHLVIDPHLARLEAGLAQQVWKAVGHTVDAKIYGPHFESVAAEWVARYAHVEAGLVVGTTGHATIACREHRVSHEIDLLSVESGTRAYASGTKIAFLAEAKCRDRKTGIDELNRLEHIQQLLTTAGHGASNAKLGLFSKSGFTDELISHANQTTQVLLVDLPALYGEKDDFADF